MTSRENDLLENNDEKRFLGLVCWRRKDAQSAYKIEKKKIMLGFGSWI